MFLNLGWKSPYLHEVRLSIQILCPICFNHVQLPASHHSSLTLFVFRQKFTLLLMFFWLELHNMR